MGVEWDAAPVCPARGQVEPGHPGERSDRRQAGVGGVPGEIDLLSSDAYAQGKHPTIPHGSDGGGEGSKPVGKGGH
jgi:hypothetical protein